MPPINPPTTTLSAIQTKVRRLTRSPSPAQLTDDDLNNYINTFVVYDFPESIRTFNLRQQFTFYTNPGQDVYPTDIASFGAASNAAKNPLYDFQNLYISVHPPVYVAGYNTFYTQSREQFFGIYPIINSISGNSGGFPLQGDGVTTTFSGFVNVNMAIVGPNVIQNTTILQNEVLFSSVDINNNGLGMIDQPILDSLTGNPTNFGILYPQNNPPSPLPFYILCTPPYNDPIVNPPFLPYVNNFINYRTGQFTVTFPFAPRIGQPINTQVVPTVVSIPQGVLYYQNQFVVRPVPDQPYRINFEVYKMPVPLLSTNAVPELNEYWQYIAYGASKKIFEDRMDTDSVAMILPEFNKQERLVLRRTIVQYTNERVATIYTENLHGPGNNGWGSGGGLF